MPERAPYVLIVEDEESIATMIQYNLEKDGFQVAVAGDGARALMEVGARRPDMIIMDWMIPVISGVDLCQRLRQQDGTHSIPIIMLTARGEESDRLMGLDSGADDYIVKPFSPRELIARIKAVLRRVQPYSGGEKEALVYGGIVVSLASRRAAFEGRVIHLGPTEFRLLSYLMEHPGRVFSREHLLDNVWGQDVYVEERTVDVHIGRLRKALADTQPGLDRIIQTVRSAGYMMEIQEI